MFDSFLGLPLHPLVVHGAVVLLPLAALGVIALVVRSAWRERFAVAVLGLLVLGAGSALVAKLSGERLAERVGLPAQHERFGNLTLIAAAALLVVGGVWLWRVRRDRDDAPGWEAALGWVSAALSAAVLVLAALVGHSGATAAWSDVMATPGVASPSPTAAATPSESATSPTATTEPMPITPSGSPSRVGSPMPTVPGGSDGYTMADVEGHNTPESCWAAINGNAYDLTDWIAQHPGGSQRIIPLCGTDATSAFTGQHEGAATPEATLERFLLGPIA